MPNPSPKPPDAEQQIRDAASGAEFINALDVLDDPVVILDTEWRYQFINQTAREVFDTRPTETLGRKIWDIFPELINTGYYRAAHQAMATQKPVEIEEYYPGRQEWYNTKFYPSQHSLVAQMRNITELKEEQRVNSQLSGSLQEAMEVYWHGKYGFNARHKSP